MLGLVPDPMEAHFPVKKTVSPQIIPEMKVSMPSLQPPIEVDEPCGANFEDYATETYEWLSLILLDSPRINPEDRIDPFLSRYVAPGNTITSCSLVKITWRGFLSPRWAHKMFVQMLLATPRTGWFAFCVDGFDGVAAGHGKHCTILKLPDVANEYVLWEIA